MAHKISDLCVSCGSCADECPVDAISEGESQYIIDENLCIDCGSCVDACSVGATSEEE
jgi:ferredoxin